MSSLGIYVINDLLTFAINTGDPANDGVPIDADSVPTYRVYKDEAGTPVATGSMAKLDDANTTGFYSEQLTLSVANGYSAGSCYNIKIAATVDSVTNETIRSFQIVDAITSVDLPTLGSDQKVMLSSDAGAIPTGAITATAIAANAITSSEIADGAITSAKFAADAITATAIVADAITAAKIAANAITSAEIADGAFTSAKIVDGAITAAKLATDSITNTAIANNAIGSSEIADSALTSAKFAADSDKYQARLHLTKDDENAVDHYSLAFFRNGQPIRSSITSPTVWIQTTGGVDLIGSSASCRAT